jgi:hypothetical protein
MRMISIKSTALAGAAAVLLAAPASASVTSYIRCDSVNVSCVHVRCNDDTGRCTWVNGYSDRWGTFGRADYLGYHRSYGRLLCVRGNGCRGDIPPAVTALAPPSP